MTNKPSLAAETLRLSDEKDKQVKKNNKTNLGGLRGPATEML